MRFFLGMLFGMFLIIAGAFLYDNWSNAPTSATTSTTTEARVERRPMVNWDVVGENWRAVRDNARDGWTRLSRMATG
jgi:hypothetical protein